MTTLPEFSRSAGVGWIEKIGTDPRAATLAITTDGRIALYATDHNGAIAAELFVVDGAQVRVSGAQQFLTFRVGGQRFRIDLSFFSTVPMSITANVASVISLGRQLHRLDVVGWVRALRATGAKVFYLSFAAIIWLSLGVVFVVVLPVAIVIAGLRVT
ncbi:MAG: hypothetical protein ABJA94_07255 [Rhodoglobus sp.]